MSIEFYIMNDIDAPDSRHVVLVEDGVGRYNLANNGLKGYEFKDFSRATKIEDFGIEINEVSNGWICIKENTSIAKYKDGQPRQWQGEHAFIIT